MGRRIGSQTRTSYLRKVFRSDNPAPIDFHVARLCVLKEDLRIELFACAEHSMEKLDIFDPLDLEEKNKAGSYRRHYFLRRSIGTLWEFAEGIRIVNDCEELQRLREYFDPEVETAWATATAFFQENEPLLKRVRNDIGGHFGSKAAEYAVRNMASDVVGKAEITYDTLGRVDPRLHFAGSLAAAAFIRHLPGSTVLEQAESFIGDLLISGYKHAASAVQILLGSHLWHRFGS